MEAVDRLTLTIILLHIFVALIVNLPQQDRITKNWARLFGIGQVIMAVQFTASRYPVLLNTDTPQILSALNNLFFLGAALILLDMENRRINWRYLLSLRLFQVVTLVTVLAISINVTALVAGTNSKQSQLLKNTTELPITLASILVYLVEGFAYFSVLGFFRHKWLRYLPILIACLYSSVEFCAYLEVEEEYLINFITPLRFLYFIPPIMILLMRMPQDTVGKKVFEDAIAERRFILSKKETGLIEALGQSIAAHKVLLLIKNLKFNLGDSDSITNQFDYYGWQEKEQADKNTYDNGDDMLADLSEEERKKLYEVCQIDLPVFCKGERQTMMLPIIMYGGIIGVLFVRLNKGIQARSIFAEKLKLSVRTVLPLVQNTRQLKAIKILSNHFTKHLIGAAGADKTAGNGTQLSVVDGVDEILVSMLETLSPLAIGLRPSQHFNSEKPVLWQIPKRESRDLKQDDFEKEFPVLMRDGFEKKYFSSERDESPLMGIKPFQEDLEFGRIIMFVQEEKDSLQHPTIGVHENIFKALAAIINTELKIILFRNLYRIIAAADKKIREAGMDGDKIVQLLQEACKTFGISWVVVLVADQNRYFGDKEKVALARQHPADDERIIGRRIITEDHHAFCLITSSTVDNSSPSNNSHSRCHINFWFGIENAGFVLDDTWEDIFLQFIQLGTNKIKDLLMNEMFIEIETKSAEIEKDKAIKTLIHLQGNLTHKFGTFIKEHEIDIESLEDDIKALRPEMPEKIEQDIAQLKASYYNLLKLTRTMFWAARITELNERDLGQENVRPCDLRRAIDNALEVVRLRLELAKIEINSDCLDGQREMIVDVPYLVVYMSIFNLLTNSIKELRRFTNQSRKKRIDITTRINGKHIFCRIKDTGEGIKNMEELYELESGWGLYLTMASLRDNNCALDLIETDSFGTAFEMRFPTYLQN